MPGPNSAPNGDDSLVPDVNTDPAKVAARREARRNAGKLYTGKTEARRRKGR